MSKENNLPELAYEAVRVEVTMAGVSKMEDEKPAMKLSDFPMYVAARSEPSGVIHIA